MPAPPKPNTARTLHLQPPTAPGLGLPTGPPDPGPQLIMAAIVSALTDGCGCDACGLLRRAAKRLKHQFAEVDGDAADN